MTIKECTISICRELGMDQEEIDRFVAYQDSTAAIECIEAVNTKTVEELGDKQVLFWAAMRLELPAWIKKFRDQSGHISVTE